MAKVKKVKKGVIIVAGLGTRFLPATVAMPKEMLPVLDKPVVQFAVEEMAASGIKEIIFVTSSQKRAIEDHFDRNLGFEDYLKKKGKYDRVKSLVDLCKQVRFFYTRQSAPLGNGHALLCAKEFIGDDTFAFSDGDSVIDSKVPVIRQLLRVYNKKRASVMGIAKSEDKQALTKYGNIMADPTRVDRVYRVKELVEKPPLNKVSKQGLYAAGMKYILTKDIWPILERQGRGKDGEIWLADAANELARKKPFYGYHYKGQYFDTGNKVALLKASIHFAKKEGILTAEDLR